MVKTRSGKRTELTIPATPKKKKPKLAWSHLYITKVRPLTISRTPKNKYDKPNKSYPYDIAVGTTLYVAAQRHCNGKWYNNGIVKKSWIYDVFLSKDDSEDHIKNYRCGEDKWIESSKIIETILQE